MSKKVLKVSRKRCFSLISISKSWIWSSEKLMFSASFFVLILTSVRYWLSLNTTIAFLTLGKRAQYLFLNFWLSVCSKGSRFLRCTLTTESVKFKFCRVKWLAFTFMLCIIKILNWKTCVISRQNRHFISPFALTFIRIRNRFYMSH